MPATACARPVFPSDPMGRIQQGTGVFRSECWDCGPDGHGNHQLWTRVRNADAQLCRHRCLFDRGIVAVVACSSNPRGRVRPCARHAPPPPPLDVALRAGRGSASVSPAAIPTLRSKWHLPVFPLSLSLFLPPLSFGRVHAITSLIGRYHRMCSLGREFSGLFQLF